jgi:hypothetical protein
MNLEKIIFRDDADETRNKKSFHIIKLFFKPTHKTLKHDENNDFLTISKKLNHQKTNLLNMYRALWRVLQSLQLVR